MINSQINTKIVDLWNRYFKGRADIRAPLFYDKLETNALLFVGVNPSFSSQGFAKVLKGTEYENLNPDTFYQWSHVSSDNKYIEDCIAIDRYSLTKYKSYFKRIEDISKKVHVPWYHIDTFLYRETSQKDFLKRIHQKQKLNNFGIDQLEIFREVLQLMQPKVVVVINAFASKTLRSFFKENLSFDESTGYHTLRLEGVSIPIFFSSYIRALDLGSYERLASHIRQAITI